MTKSQENSSHRIGENISQIISQNLCKTGLNFKELELLE